MRLVHLIEFRVAPLFVQYVMCMQIATLSTHVGLITFFFLTLSFYCTAILFRTPFFHLVPPAAGWSFNSLLSKFIYSTHFIATILLEGEKCCVHKSSANRHPASRASEQAEFIMTIMWLNLCISTQKISGAHTHTHTHTHTQHSQKT